MDDDKPRRKRRAKAAAIEIEQEPNLLMRALLHSPKDTLAGVVAAGAMTAIVVNAMFLQPGHHPSPMFGAMPVEMSVAAPAQPLPRPRPAEIDAQPANVIDPKPMVAIAPAKPAPAPAVTRPPASVPAHKDPLGDLISANHRVISVQRVLTDYGYGQLKANGTIGADTKAAIRKFEADRRHAQTGQISDWLLHEMAKLTGKAIN